MLIADDSDFMRNLMREILREDHDVVGVATNGVEVVEMYRKMEPDLVMMDIAMPIRDGIEATAEIKEANAEANVIMCTTVGHEENMQEAERVGADGFITKPFQKSNVLEAIGDVVSV